jgi:putative membrane protein
MAIAVLSRVKIETDLSFDVHLFALFNSFINTCVSILLIIGLTLIQRKKYKLHRNVMIAAIILSTLFLLSYIAHHLLAGDTKFGDTDHDGVLSDAEKDTAGSMRYIYYVLLLTHIPLAAIILPMILFTAYRALTGEYSRHKKTARITWPIWFYVAVSGVIVYWMIQPYY